MTTQGNGTGNSGGKPPRHAARRILCLPIYPTLTDEQHGLICDPVRNMPR